MEHLHPRPTTHHRPSSPPRSYIPDKLQRCPMVWLRHDGHHPPLTPRYGGTYEVLERHPKFFRLRLGDREYLVAVDRLKPADLSKGTGPAIPPRQGRPPAQPPEQPPAQHPLASTTPSGHVIRQPARYIQCVGGPCSGYSPGNRTGIYTSDLDTMISL